MARLVEEFFEATGYDQAGWSETVPGTCVVDEDEASSAAGTPPGWGGQCLKIVLDGGGADCHTLLQFGDGAVRFGAMDIKVSASGLDTNGNQITAGAYFNNAGTTRTALFVIVRSGGVTYVAVYFYLDGTTATLVHSEVFALDKLYRWEIRWDQTANEAQMWLNNVLLGSGTYTITGTADTGLVLCGDILNSTKTATFRIDRVEVDGAARIGGWAVSSGLVGGKLANNPVLTRGALI